MNNITKVRIIRNNEEKSIQVAENLKALLVNSGLELTNKKADLVVFIGGDGTFLSGCNMIKFDEDAICIGINTGKLGVLQNYSGGLKELVEYIKDESHINTKKLPLLDITITQKYKSPVILKAVNDIVISGRGLSLIEYNEWVNEAFFQKCCSSGIIVSSTIGSTGISKDYNSAIIVSDDRRVLRTLVGADNYKVIPFIGSSILANPLICSKYKIELNKIYKGAEMLIDGMVKKEISVDDITSIEVEYSKSCINLLELNNTMTREELIREKIIPRI